MVVTLETFNMALCYSIITDWYFDYQKRLEWEIYSSKHRACFSCKASEYEPCRNLSDLNFNKKNPDKLREVRVNKRAHNDRIDWSRMLSGLKQRGYYRPAIEAQVRKQIR